MSSRSTGTRTAIRCTRPWRPMPPATSWWPGIVPASTPDPGVFARWFDQVPETAATPFAVSSDRHGRPGRYVRRFRSERELRRVLAERGSGHPGHLRPAVSSRAASSRTASNRGDLLAAWSSSGHRRRATSTSRTAAAHRPHRAWACAALVDDTAGLFVAGRHARRREHRYRVRFHFDPERVRSRRGAEPRSGTRMFIAFDGRPAAGVAAVVLRRIGGAYSCDGRVPARRRRAGQHCFVPIADAPHVVEIDLACAARDADARRRSVRAARRTACRRSTLQRPRQQPRPRWTSRGWERSASKTGANGTMYWDEFESVDVETDRGPLIKPPPEAGAVLRAQIRRTCPAAGASPPPLPLRCALDFAAPERVARRVHHGSAGRGRGRDDHGQAEIVVHGGGCPTGDGAPAPAPVR